MGANTIENKHLHGDLVLNGCVLVSKAVPSRLQTFAVTAPGGIEFDEDILGVIEDNVLESFANNRVDTLVLGFRDRLALERRLEFASEVLFNPLRCEFGGNVFTLVERVLQLFAEVLNNEGRPLGLDEVKSATVVTELDGIDPNKVHLELELLGNGAESLDMLVLVLRSGIKEEVGERLVTVGVDSIVLAANLINDGDSKLLDPIRDILNLEIGNRVGVFCAGLIEVTVNNESRGLDACSGSSILVSRETE